MFDSQITISGNVVERPTLRHLASGATVSSFRVASTRRRFDRATSSWADDETVYLTVTCWRQLADNVAASLGRGDGVLVVGRLTQHSYDDKEGVRRTAYEIDAQNVGPDLTFAIARPRRLKRSAAEEAEAVVTAAEEAADESVEDAGSSWTVGENAGQYDETAEPAPVPVAV